MTQPHNRKAALLSASAILLGNILFALTLKLFVMPSGLIMGGATGVALAVNRAFGLSVSGVLLVFNVSMLILGWLVLGRTFAISTLASTFLSPVALEFWERLLGDYVLTDDLLLCTVFAGLGIGVSLGMVIRAGASTGGMDIPPLVLNKLCRLPVSVSMFFFDLLILLTQAMSTPADQILYGILVVLISTTVLDKVIMVGTTRTEVKIISSKADEIRAAILSQIDRGVTILHGEGGYLHQPTQLLLCVVSNRELPRLEKLIHSIDPASFVIVGHVSEVSGRGFSLSKHYTNQEHDQD
ncbi:YitT family protein [Faecalibacterium gallinarum]|uniref:Membrane protein n=1 Tax=Faecalibacterium gallinarum TaxID=2903556 RepID=A0AA37IZ83_9FIRM|nr:YitT family protein [Faecalibacterium gallinarum]GJN64729.1 membrane protein [Faecalibacterium gallinarum]